MSKTSIFIKAFSDFTDIDSANALKKAKLTQSDYIELYEHMKEISQNRSTPVETISENVKNWFSRHSFTIKNKGIGWQISL